MPRPVSDQHRGTPQRAPYVPDWCYAAGARMCRCGHHEGFHWQDVGACKGSGCECIRFEEIEES